MKKHRKFTRITKHQLKGRSRTGRGTAVRTARRGRRGKGGVAAAGVWMNRAFSRPETRIGPHPKHNAVGARYVCLRYCSAAYVGTPYTVAAAVALCMSASGSLHLCSGHTSDRCPKQRAGARKTTFSSTTPPLRRRHCMAVPQARLERGMSADTYPRRFYPFPNPTPPVAGRLSASHLKQYTFLSPASAAAGGGFVLSPPTVLHFAFPRLQPSAAIAVLPAKI